MTASSADIAELTRTPAAIALVEAPDDVASVEPEEILVVVPAVDRLALRAQRRQIRRERRMYVAAALGILVLFLFATIVVLDMVR